MFLDNIWIEVGVVQFTFIFGIFLYFKYHYSYWKRKGIEYIKPTLFFGNFKDALLGRENAIILMKKIHDQIKGPFGGAFILTQPSLFVKDPKLIKQILVKDFEFFVNRGLPVNEKDDPLSGNLFSLSDERWRFMRNKFSPTFSSGKLKQMVNNFVIHGQRLQEYLSKVAISNNNIIEARDMLSRYTIDSIALIAFGFECDSTNEDISTKENTFFKIGNYIANPPRNEILTILLMVFAPKIVNFLKLKLVAKHVEEFIRAITEKSLDLRENQKVVRQDFMQLVVQLRNSGKINTDESWNVSISEDKKLSVEEVMAQVFLFFSAGFDTSSSAMAFTLFELAKNKEIQRKTQNDIDEALKKHNNEWSYDCIQDMKYLDQVFEEGLRLYPSLPFLNRQAARDYKIPGTDVIISKGTLITIHTLGLHLDAQHHPNPLVFDPDRFTPEAKATRDPFTYLPFGDGPRNCIGMRYGQLQSKIGLASVLSKFNFDLARSPNIEFGKNSFFSAEGGLLLKVSPRE